MGAVLAAQELCRQFIIVFIFFVIQGLPSESNGHIHHIRAMWPSGVGFILVIKVHQGYFGPNVSPGGWFLASKPHTKCSNVLYAYS
jgi:hypothetical protein